MPSDCLRRGAVCREEVCAQKNSGTALVCTACGALGWDGAHGQLRAQLSTILLTSDLGRTSKKQLMRRLRQTTQYEFPKKAINRALAEVLKAAGESPREWAGVARADLCDRLGLRDAFPGGRLVFA